MGRPPRTVSDDPANPARAAIARLGGARALARLLKLPPTTVQGWHERGVIPAWRQPAVLAAAAEVGIALRPQDFFRPEEAEVAATAAPLERDEAPLEVLTVAEMAEADRRTIAAGTDGIRLMEAAGKAVADEVARRFPGRPVIVLCGPGNNGGDGFVAARHLRALGWRMRLALLGDFGALKGDAAVAAAAYKGAVVPLAPDVLNGAAADDAVVIDALFGTGLTRPLTGVALATVRRLNRARVPVVAVDIPSGVSGDTGEVLGGEDGAAPRASVTITFFRKKPAHLLMPGREFCGDIVLTEIGIKASILDVIAPRLAENGPALWADSFPWPRLSDHKYRRGHAVIAGGAEMTGAARLAARACLRMGAGLVTIATPPEAHAIYAATMPGILMNVVGHPTDFAKIMEDQRKNAILLGPGNGVTAATRAHVLFALEAGKRCVLDADALTVFADRPQDLIAALRSAAEAGKGPAAVLTPHEGEFARLFGRAGLDFGSGSKIARARAAAEATGAVVLLKGPDTTVAHPDGRAWINANAPPTLATAGAGDVLAGFIAGLLAQGMEPFAAASAAVWLHGAAAEAFGPGLIAEDLPDLLPSALRELRELSG